MTISQIHLRFDGQTQEIDATQLDVGNESTDQQVREAVANYLSVPLAKLTNYVLDRNLGSGVLTLRPQATFAKV